MKAETYLRYREIEFESVACNPRKSPSKQIPFITIDELGDSRTITDSEKIIRYFESRQDKPMDVGLTTLQKATAYLIRSKVEEDLYWQITYMRWGDPEGWAVFLPDLKKHMEGLKGKFLPSIIRRMLLRQMARRGMKPEKTEASYAPGIKLLDVLSDILGKKEYFLGKDIRTLDKFKI